MLENRKGRRKKTTFTIIIDDYNEYYLFCWKKGKGEKKRRLTIIIDDYNEYFVLCWKKEGKKEDINAVIREYDSTLYVGLACAVSPTNTNFRLTFLLTRLQEALYKDLAV